MKFSKAFVDRNQFAKKLGVGADQISIANVESNLNDVTITLAVDNDAVLTGSIDAITMLRGGENMRRFRLIDDSEELPKDAYDKVFYYIDKSIDEMKKIQDENKEDSFMHTQALKSQFELEQVKLNLLKHHVNLRENVILQCGTWI